MPGRSLPTTSGQPLRGPLPKAEAVTLTVPRGGARNKGAITRSPHGPKTPTLCRQLTCPREPLFQMEPEGDGLHPECSLQKGTSVTSPPANRATAGSGGRGLCVWSWRVPGSIPPPGRRSPVARSGAVQYQADLLVIQDYVRSPYVTTRYADGVDPIVIVLIPAQVGVHPHLPDPQIGSQDLVPLVLEQGEMRRGACEMQPPLERGEKIGAAAGFTLTPSV